MNKKQTIRLNESQLRRIVKESVKRTLNEYGGWTQDPMDWPVVNTSDDGNNLYKVGLWWGSGYVLDIYLAWAQGEYDALEKVVAYLSKKYPEALEEVDKYAEETIQDIVNEKGCDRYEAEEYPEFYERFEYVDATMDGADAPHYIWNENLTIMQAPKEWKSKFLEREKNSNSFDDTINESVRRAIRRHIR